MAKKKKRKKRKPRYNKSISTKGALVPVETPEEMRKEFPQDLIDTYLEVLATDFENEKVYKKWNKLAKKFLGDKADDPIEDGKLVVRLTRATMDIRPAKRCKDHPKYQAIRKPKVDCKACWAMYNEKAKEKQKAKKKTKKQKAKTEATQLARPECSPAKSGTDEGQKEGS